MRRATIFLTLSAILLVAAVLPGAPAPAQTTGQGADRSARVEALVRRGEAHRAAGRLREGFADLRDALALAPAGSVRRFALAALGAAEAEAGLRTAEPRLRAALDAGPLALDTAGAVAAAHLARLVAGRGDLAEAEALALAATAAAGTALVSAFAETVAGEVADVLGRPAEAEARFRAATARLDRMAPEGTAAEARLDTASALLAGPAPDAARAALVRRLLDPLVRSDAPRLAAEAALGHARLARRLGATAQVLDRAGEAVARAQAAGADDLLYRAFRLRAEAAVAAGRPDAALDAYRSAFESLRAVRNDLVGRFDAEGRSLYRLTLADFHTAFVDLLLAEGRRPGRDAQALRAEARLVIEDLKVLEVEDYFQERCVASADPVAVDRAARRVAVLYPILLDDRLELLVSRQGRLESRTSSVGRAALAALVADALAASSDPAEPYRAASRRLHDALVAPVADLLDPASIDTVVYVPDGALRSFPLGALWDGERFFVERLAVATVLGLGLIPGKGVGASGREALVVGASETVVEGFPPIPGVVDEATRVAALLGGELRLGQSFPAGEAPGILRRAPYTVVHIAAHAAFGVEPADNFIALSDGRVDVPTLVEALRARAIEGGRPIELMTLSACETARGTDRAPLGLAGAAYRANVRSALASLWLISDEATTELMVDFYGILAVPGTGRAEALAMAQRRFLKRFPAARHPAFWGAFILLGAWD